VTTAPPPPAGDVSFGAVFSASWRLFRTNWTIALPPVIAGFAALALLCVYVVALIAVVGVAGWRAIFAPHATVPEPVVTSLVATGLLGGAVLWLLTIVLVVWAESAMYGMADAAWTRGTATFGDGFAAFRTRGGAVFVAGIGIFGLAIVAVILALPTLFLSIFALPLVTLFVLPAAVGGRRGGFEAIGESFRLLRAFFVPTLVTWLVLYAIQYGISFLTGFAIVPLELSAMPATPDALPTMPPIPVLGFSGTMYFASVLLLLAYNGFRATVEVGLFRELEARRAGTTMLPPASPPPTIIIPPA
jgi:hypothetical protein